jgi:ProP effector
MTVPDTDPTRALLQDLQARFAVFRDAQPLAIGIDAAILSRLPETNHKTLRAALRFHTGSTRYLKALQGASHRVDLDGNPAGEVSPAQRRHAADTLKARFQKAAQVRKAQAEAAEGEARQKEKLTQLVAKFSR